MRRLPLGAALLAVLAAGCGSGAGGDSQAATTGSQTTTTGPSATTTRPARANVPWPTLAAAGDIACPAALRRSTTECRQADTARVLAALHADVVAPLGDLQYDTGSLGSWSRGAFVPTWGKFKSRMRPAIGNHEYNGTSPDGYRRFFGARAGPRGRYWYSYDLGSWHVVVLNSNCSIVGCAAGG